MGTTNVENMVQRAITLGRKYNEMVELIITRICGYNPIQVRICGYMTKRGGSILQKELEGIFGLSRPAISQTVDQMVANGLVTRDGGVEKDRRLKRLSLAPYGTALAKKTNTALARFYRSMGQNLSDEEVEQFSRILDKLDATLESEGDKAAF